MSALHDCNNTIPIILALRIHIQSPSFQLLRFENLASDTKEKKKNTRKVIKESVKYLSHFF